MAVETEEENERLLAEAERLIDKGGRRTPEEDRLLRLLSIAIQAFEEQRYPTPDPTPHQMVCFLMEQRNLRQRDLLPVFGSRSVASDVVNGKRGISKSQAKGLGAFFRVSPELFL